MGKRLKSIVNDDGWSKLYQSTMYYYKEELPGSVADNLLSSYTLRFDISKNARNSDFVLLLTS